MRTRYYYDADTDVAYKVVGEGRCPCGLDLDMYLCHSAERTTCKDVSRHLKRDMTKSYNWFIVDIINGVRTYTAY